MTRLLTVWSMVCLYGCGTGEFAVSNTSYEPRLVIEGLLQPGVGVDGIRITRNFRVDAQIRRDVLIPQDIRATIVDERTKQVFALQMHDAALVEDRLFYYDGDDLVIEHGQSYTLEVSATVEGKELTARATTIVPERGFRIADVSEEAMPYRPLDESGEPINFAVEIERSPGSRFYLMTVRPLVATSANFVYDNPFTEQKPNEVEEDIDDFNFEWDWIQNTPREAGISTIEVFWFFLWFYGEHEVVIYAADQNYASFIQTHDQVQEDDGNFHEPQFLIEGDGIGYFGSALVDTVHVQVLR
ncbi:MAG: hypothetical protein ACI906_000646 [Candidatus Latescibacterota bacterium]|jgi:hypothetical protein